MNEPITLKNSQKLKFLRLVNHLRPPILQLKAEKKFGFYFVDDADKIKAWIEQKQIPEM